MVAVVVGSGGALLELGQNRSPFSVLTGTLKTSPYTTLRQIFQGGWGGPWP